jgi:hypothetical protein
VIAAPDVSEEDLRTAALADERCGVDDGHEVVKVIVVPQRLVNIVIGERNCRGGPPWPTPSRNSTKGRNGGPPLQLRRSLAIILSVACSSASR